MKLVIAIVQSDDSGVLSDALRDHDLSPDECIAARKKMENKN